MQTALVERDEGGIWRPIVSHLAHIGIPAGSVASREELLDRVRDVGVGAAIIFEDDGKLAESVRVTAHPDLRLVVLTMNTAVLPENGRNLVIRPIWVDQLPQVLDFVRKPQGLPNG